MKRALMTLFCLAMLNVQTAWCGSDPIWTDRPVRIDRSKQTYERLPAIVSGVENGKSFSFPYRPTIHDSVSFAADNQEYVFSELIPVAANRICMTATGARWPCGRNASIYLSNVIAGKSMVCEATPHNDKMELSHCLTEKGPIANDLISRGFAFPRTDNPEFLPFLTAAKAKKAGAWADINCHTESLSC